MCFDKLKELFVDPSKFFKDVSKEKSYWNVLKLFVVVYIVATIIQILVSIPVNLKTLGNQFLPFILTALISGIIFAFAIPFIVGILSHLGILLVGGKKGFFNTFKAITYGTIVIVGYGIISSVAESLILLFSSNVAISNFVIGVISLIGVVHMLIVQSVGVSIFHSISRGKSFFGIILIPLIIFIMMIAMGSIFITQIIGG